jgi:hypothetical protein
MICHRDPLHNTASGSMNSSHTELVLTPTVYYFGSRVAQSVQCLTTGWTTGQSEFDPRQEQGIFPLSSVSRPALRPTQPPVKWVPGVLSPGVKARLERDADHSPPSSAEVVIE